MRCAHVTSLRDALHVRRLRNTCREHMTNYDAHISVWQQVRWYWKTYRHAQRKGEYRLYLFWDDSQQSIGYGALQRHGDELYVTECVDAAKRGHGYGHQILNALSEIAEEERRALVAEIWGTNAASIALHEHQGFSLDSTRVLNGRELRCYKKTFAGS
jgi:RimJ/RimL family protein N-acetyltransferase